MLCALSIVASIYFLLFELETSGIDRNGEQKLENPIHCDHVEQFQNVTNNNSMTTSSHHSNNVFIFLYYCIWNLFCSHSVQNHHFVSFLSHVVKPINLQSIKNFSCIILNSHFARQINMFNESSLHLNANFNVWNRT